MPLEHGLAQRYRPRDPTRGLLFRVVKRNLDPFLEASEGRLPRHVERAFRKFLDCGVLDKGFARAHCDTCNLDMLVPFS